MKVKESIKRYLIGKQNKRYEKEVRRQYETYDAWIRRLEREKERKEAAGEGPRAEKNFVWLPAGEGSFASEADTRVSAYFATHPQCMVVYGDEDILEAESGERSKPWFKPDWSPDTFLSYDYFGNAVAVRKSFLDSCGYMLTQITPENRRQVLLRCIQECGGFQPKCQAIGHIQEILFHGRNEESRNGYLEVSLKEEALGRTQTEDMVSVIIPSKDNVSVLKQCIISVLNTVRNREIEFIIVDNGSCDNTVENIHKLKEDLTEGKIRYIYEPMEFNFSKMCNLGAKAAEGNLLLFLNDDTQAASSGWLEAMVSKAVQPYVGAVGMKLLYPDNGRIQHAGIVNLPMGPVHKLQFLTDHKIYDFGRNRIALNVLAVTAACLMIKKERFWEVGGFCETLKVAFNDVELCFRLYEAGFHNVVINSHFFYHHESLSRGSDESDAKFKRLMEERKRLYEMHPELEGKDPYYSPFLNRNGLDTRILPGNEDSRGETDHVRVNVLSKEPEHDRRDECLLLRIERAEPTHMQGYAVVLGDNNACYDMKVIWKYEGGNEGEAIYGYEADLPPVYRSDLKENMADQVNVALSGFCICPEGIIRPGSYRIGVVARNRISGQKILNFSSRFVQIL